MNRLFKNSLAAVLFIACLMILLMAAGCSTIPKDYPREESFALQSPDQTALGEAFAEAEETHPDASGYRLLTDGVNAFVARLALMEAAEETVDIQYYIYRMDTVGQMLSKSLIDAADRGVRIRLLLDDMEIGDNDFRFAVLASHPNIQMRIFNPFAGRSKFGMLWSILMSFDRINQRMHNKIFAVDNQLAIVGGRNIANEYFTVEPNQYFADLEVLATGPIVRQASASFDHFWNSVLSVPINVLMAKKPNEQDLVDLKRQFATTWQSDRAQAYRDRLQNSPFPETINQGQFDFIWAPAEVVYDSPDQIIRNGKENDQLTLLGAYLEPHFRQTRQELVLISPYMIPGDKGMFLFRQLSGRDVNLRILTNSLAASDMAAVYGAYAGYRKPILRLGAELYELKPGAGQEETDRQKPTSVGATLHAKTLVFDRDKVFIGSMNLDPRSVYLNTELGIIVNSKELATEIAQHFAQLTSPEASFRLSLDEGGDVVWTTTEQGAAVRYHRSPYVSLWDIFWADLVELLIPNSLL